MALIITLILNQGTADLWNSVPVPRQHLRSQTISFASDSKFGFIMKLNLDSVKSNTAYGVSITFRSSQKLID